MNMQAAVGDRELARATDDAQLVAALRRGDREAFAALVDENGSWMMRIALTYVSSRAVAEETVQEAWMRCLRGLDGFEGRSALKSWLFVIVANCARRRAERDARSVPFSEFVRLEGEGNESDPLEGRFFDGSHPRWANCWSTFSRSWEQTPEQRLLAGETTTTIQAAARRLPEGQRTVFLLRDVEGWSTEEVCQALSISASNQRVLLHRARNSLRLVLEEYLQAEEAG
jgi:RNA polymerase sigma-70 factor (ECF subfamily)